MILVTIPGNFGIPGDIGTPQLKNLKDHCVKAQLLAKWKKNKAVVTFQQNILHGHIQSNAN